MSESKSTPRLKAGILGATGTVGQRFIQLLENHPWFQAFALGASPKSAGKTYAEVVRWKLSSCIPDSAKSLVVKACDPKEFEGCDLIFSALDSSVAGSIEEAFAQADFPVFSNAKNHRYDDTVPIVIPHTNPDHLNIIPHQRKLLNYKKGFIVTNANCSSTGLVVALKPLMDQFGLEKIFVVTMQAVSGAGYPGVSSFDILDNVIPYISGEEPKMEYEPLKILGKVEDGKFVNANFAVSAHCNRVATLDGHMECVSIKLAKSATIEEVVHAFTSYRSEAQELKLPSAPPAPIVVLEGEDRPQPRLDRDLHGGFVVTVGRVRKCPLFDIKFTFCSHNTIIGAAGGSILNAELAYAKKLL